MLDFFIYNSYNNDFFYYICHNLQNRKIQLDTDVIMRGDYKLIEFVTGEYNGITCNFFFNKFNGVDESRMVNGYHLISRRESVEHGCFIEPPLNGLQNTLGFPTCLKSEYEILIKELDEGSKWVLFWNFGENKFVHINNDSVDELNLLKEFSEKGILVSDNFIKKNTNVSDYIEPTKLKHFLSNDLFMWNSMAKIFYANEFRPIYDNLNYKYKLAISFRFPKKHRIDICKTVSELNRDDIFLSYSSHFFERRGNQTYYDGESSSNNYNDTYGELETISNLNINKVGDYSEIDYKNLLLLSNDTSALELDYYYRILTQAPVILLDETHSYNTDDDIPMNLSEKTYILILANKAFLSTHHYPLDIIREYILDIEHPYYNEIKEAAGNPSKIVNLIDNFLNNFDTMYPLLLEYTNQLNSKLLSVLNSENSFLEHMTTKINQ